MWLGMLAPTSVGNSERGQPPVGANELHRGGENGDGDDVGDGDVHEASVRGYSWLKVRRG